MRLEFYSEKKLKKEILEIIGKYLDLKKYKVFFFGSRVNGKGDERSDIDIGIEGRWAVPNNILPEIEEKIKNLPTLYRIDIIDFTRASDKFKKVAKQSIERIN